MAVMAAILQFFGIGLTTALFAYKPLAGARSYMLTGTCHVFLIHNGGTSHDRSRYPQARPCRCEAQSSQCPMIATCRPWCERDAFAAQRKREAKSSCQHFISRSIQQDERLSSIMHSIHSLCKESPKITNGIRNFIVSITHVSLSHEPP